MSVIECARRWSCEGVAPPLRAGRFAVAMLSLWVGLAGCGGGGGVAMQGSAADPPAVSASSPPMPASPVAAPAPVPAAEPSAQSSSGSAIAWSDLALWGGSPPGPQAAVLIPAGKTVMLDTDVDVRNLTVEGTLRCARTDASLRANWILVGKTGRFECGTADAPHSHRLTILLNATDPSEDVMGMGTKFFGAIGGVVDLHGVQKTSWTRLDGTAESGARRIRVLDATNWQAGDRIVVAPTDFEPTEAEIRTVTRVEGRLLELDAPLAHRHWGKVQVLGATGAVMDQRAEVGLLSRSITIRGERPSASVFGGHTMFMAGATVRISGVEFAGMGQQGTLGRYPVHFHLLGDAGARSFLKGSSIHGSVQRGLVVHRTNNLVVQDNVLFDMVGHAVFLESSNEVRNSFERNLVMLTRPVPPERMNPLIAFEHIPDHESRHSRVSGFWISNQQNRFVGNHVVGILGGHGYWFVEGQALYESRDNDLWDFRPGGESQPTYRGVLQFEDNVAHTIRPASELGGSDVLRVSGNAVMLDALHFSADYVPVIKNLRAWKVSMYAVWGVPWYVPPPVIDNMVVADTKSAVFNGEHNGAMRIRGGVFYAMTDNQPPGLDARTRNWSALWDLFGNGGDDRTIRAVETYPDVLPGHAILSGPVPEASMQAPGSVTKGQRFAEFSNVVVDGWPEVP